MIDIQLRPGHVTSADVYNSTPGDFPFGLGLYVGHTTGADVVNRPHPYYSPPSGVVPPPPFPTQYAGLRVYHGAAALELCLVSTADGASGMGGIPHIRKAGVTYAIYLVETSDPLATPVRIRTSLGTKAVRVKT